MISQQWMDRWIEEDVPYLDLTTQILEIGMQSGGIRWYSREEAVAACVDEAAALAQRCGLTVTGRVESGARIHPQETLLEAKGTMDCLHRAWKVILNLLEYACGISTRTASLVAAVRTVSPTVAVLTTRKVFPGTKFVSIAAAVAGGALPHRLGLGETILIFENHLRQMGGYDGLVARLPAMKARVCDKDICVEVEREEDAMKMIRAGADALQFDKLPPDVVGEIVKKIRAAGSNARLIAAGGVNVENAAAYASAGVDAISTSWIYFGKPVDMSAIVE